MAAVHVEALRQVDVERRLFPMVPSCFNVTLNLFLLINMSHALEYTLYQLSEALLVGVVARATQLLHKHALIELEHVVLVLEVLQVGLSGE